MADSDLVESEVLTNEQESPKSPGRSGYVTWQLAAFLAVSLVKQAEESPGRLRKCQHIFECILQTEIHNATHKT